MSWFSSEADRYTGELYDVDDPTKPPETVTFKRLTAGEYAEVQDIIFDPDRGEGAVRMAIISRALVSWTLQEELTEAILSALKPEVFQQLWLLVDERDVNPFSAARAAAARTETAADAGSTNDDAD